MVSVLMNVTTTMMIPLAQAEAEFRRADQIRASSFIFKSDLKYHSPRKCAAFTVIWTFLSASK